MLKLISNVFDFAFIDDNLDVQCDEESFKKES